MASISKLTSQDVATIKPRRRIAADYDLNQGRISEIATGKRFLDMPPAQEVQHGQG